MAWGKAAALSVSVFYLSLYSHDFPQRGLRSTILHLRYCSELCWRVHQQDGLTYRGYDIFGSEFIRNLLRRDWTLAVIRVHSTANGDAVLEYTHNEQKVLSPPVD